MKLLKLIDLKSDCTLSFLDKLIKLVWVMDLGEKLPWRRLCAIYRISMPIISPQLLYNLLVNPYDH